MADQWNQAVRKLTEMTRSGELKWEPNHDLCRRRQRELDCVGPAYLATVSGKRIAIYEFRYEHFGEFGDSSWNTGIAIEFIDQNYEPEWVWPGVDEHYPLLEAVRHQSAHANEFLESFLATSA